jgi:hypothetical protein
MVLIEFILSSRCSIDLSVVRLVRQLCCVQECVLVSILVGASDELLGVLSSLLTCAGMSHQSDDTGFSDGDHAAAGGGQSAPVLRGAHEH